MLRICSTDFNGTAVTFASSIAILPSLQPSTGYWCFKYRRRLADDMGDDVSDSDVSYDNGSDLDDFVVCKPGRDYRSFFAQQFKYTCSEPRTAFNQL